MSLFVDTIKDFRAKREAARQYVLAADRFREMARDERAEGRDGNELEAIADELIRNASFEVTEG